MAPEIVPRLVLAGRRQCPPGEAENARFAWQILPDLRYEMNSSQEIAGQMSVGLPTPPTATAQPSQS
jgi:hypothetical protein